MTVATPIHFNRSPDLARAWRMAARRHDRVYSVLPTVFILAPTIHATVYFEGYLLATSVHFLHAVWLLWFAPDTA